MRPGSSLPDGTAPRQLATVLTPEAASTYLRDRHGVVIHPSWLLMLSGTGAGPAAVGGGFEPGELDRWGLLQPPSAEGTPSEIPGAGRPVPGGVPGTKGAGGRAAGRSSRPRDAFKEERAAAKAWKDWVRGGARGGHRPPEAREDLIEGRLRGLRAHWRQETDLAAQQGRPVPAEPGVRNAVASLQADERRRAEGWEVALREALGAPGHALLAATVHPPSDFVRGAANEARETALALRIVARGVRRALQKQKVALAWHGHVLEPDRAGRAIMHVLFVADAEHLRLVEAALRTEAGKVLLGGTQLDLGLDLVAVVDPASLEGTRLRGGGSIVAGMLGASWPAGPRPAGGAIDAIDRRAWAKVFAVGATLRAARVGAGETEEETLPSTSQQSAGRARQHPEAAPG